MTDRPILFSALMIRALLDGRKTQTRRVLTLGGRRPDYIGPRGCTEDPACWGWDDGRGGYILADRDSDDAQAATWHDFAASWRAGDRAWVREAHAILPATAYRGSIGTGTIVQTVHPTDGYSAAVMREGFDRSGAPRWRPSIHMPRWASRLTLTVTDVRVQRLWDISEKDAKAEGVPPPPEGIAPEWSHYDSYVDVFADVWDSLNAERAPWGSNPWVVALSFTVQRGNIDQVGLTDRQLRDQITGGDI
ncbi:hypothetical protein [Paracoccus marcusii]|uniref:Uncharacterized protein n=1 Tax=Paracoccus marcusii TaxID=59779 RepID=A0ABY7UNC4_9RHOB|nr:hypothetical protein [Paracoccus marcusii]WDA11435.1 hypothetical protein PRL19_08885 [Paracoccus marcusii]